LFHALPKKRKKNLAGASLEFSFGTFPHLPSKGGVKKARRMEERIGAVKKRTNKSDYGEEGWKSKQCAGGTLLLSCAGRSKKERKNHIFHRTKGKRSLRSWWYKKEPGPIQDIQKKASASRHKEKI